MRPELEAALKLAHQFKEAAVEYESPPEKAML